MASPQKESPEKRGEKSKTLDSTHIPVVITCRSAVKPAVPSLTHGPTALDLMMNNPMTEANGNAPSADAHCSIYNRKNPFPAKLSQHLSLTLPGSLKDTRHFVLDLASSGICYTPGDSLGVVARNSASLVQEVLQGLRLLPETPVDMPSGQKQTLASALETGFILNRVNHKFIRALADILPSGSSQSKLQDLLRDKATLDHYIYSRDYVDVLSDFPEARPESAAWFLETLTPIPPRLYSIASSQKAHPNEVQLCVAIVRYHTHGRPKAGLCTGFLADHTEINQTDIPVYVQVTKSFRLPEDGARDIIMVGPGTGIAPFRAFLEEREINGDAGRNWLIFGEQHRATDFLYGDQLLAWEKKGLLDQLDLAFSRDQDHKIYVQDRMKEKAAALWDWLQNGAYFYVCGDAKRMAKDVHQTLKEIAMDQGGLNQGQADEYIDQTLMRTEKRYLRDVY